jgi:hypothetical protein
VCMRRGHYTGTHTTDAAQSCGKALWSSEDISSYDDETGGGCAARVRMLPWQPFVCLSFASTTWKLLDSVRIINSRHNIDFS